MLINSFDEKIYNKEEIKVTYTLITGASGGIGYEFASVFAKNQHNLILVARNQDKLQQIKTEFESKYGISVIVFSIDLSKRDAADELHEKTKKAGYQINNLINNAGFGDWAVFLDSNWDKQYEMVQLNITALMQMTYLYGNDMRKNGIGHILNLSSVAAFSAGPYMSIYYATKGYVLSFSQSVSEELRGTGVKVTAYCPGPTSTGFEKAAEMKKSKMFTFMKPAIPKEVAEYGYKKMMQGKAVVYHGFFTKMANIGSRIVPRSIGAKFAGVINGR